MERRSVKSLRPVTMSLRPLRTRLAGVSTSFARCLVSQRPRYATSNGGGSGDARTPAAPTPPSTSAFEPLPTPPRPGSPSLRVPYPPSGLDLPESTFLKCIEKEIMDEKYRLDKEAGPPAIPAGWEFYHPPGTSLIYGRCVWLPSQPPVEAPSDTKVGDDDDDGNGAKVAPPRRRLTEQHYVRMQLTTRDASLDPECDIRGEHFPFSFFVKLIEETPADGTTPHETPQGREASATSSQGDDVDHKEAAWVQDLEGRQGLAASDGSGASPLYQNSVEVRCDVIDGELVVDNVVHHGIFNVYGQRKRRAAAEAAAAAHPDRGGTVQYDNPFGGYAGPNLDEAEEEILDGIQSWLAERRIDDMFGEFIGQYAIWVEQAEYESWLQQLHDYVAA